MSDQFCGHLLLVRIIFEKTERQHSLFTYCHFSPLTARHLLDGYYIEVSNH
jgi:hypothetical protein